MPVILQNVICVLEYVLPSSCVALSLGAANERGLERDVSSGTDAAMLVGGSLLTLTLILPRGDRT